MIRLPQSHLPPLGLGVTSLVLGTVGLMLFFLPILGLPLSALGLCCGLLSFGIGLASARSSLYWSARGVIVGAAALAVNLALAYAPEGYLTDPAMPQRWQPVSDRPWVAPPARPGFWDAAPPP